LLLVSFSPRSTPIQVLAVNLIICYLKLFKYLKQIPSLEHLFTKIFCTFTDVFYLLVSFTFIFWGFSLSYFLAYGDTPQNYQPPFLA
jgi:hypothetical protein